MKYDAIIIGSGQAGNPLAYRLAGVPSGPVTVRAFFTGFDELEMKVEVVAGLNGNENVIINPPDSVTEGETVRIAATAQGTQ